MKIKLLKIFSRIPFLVKLFHLVQRISLPGFNSVPIYDVIVFFIKRFSENDLQTLARSIAFSVFLAIFPTIIFLFTLIPYVPIDDFQLQVMQLLREFLPSGTYESAYSTIEDIVSHQRGGLLSFGFLFALFISAEGVLSLIEWFDKSFHGSNQRSQLKQRLISIALTIVLAIFTFFAIALLILNEVATSFLVEQNLLTNDLQYFLLQSLKWIILITLCFSGISLLYYFGPSKPNKKIPFINAGSLLATVLIILTSLGFNFFLNNFGSYNKIYGSIGTLMVILIWIFLNSLVLLIGYELNVAIDRASTMRNKKITKL